MYDSDCKAIRLLDKLKEDFNFQPDEYRGSTEDITLIWKKEYDLKFIKKLLISFCEEQEYSIKPLNSRIDVLLGSEFNNHGTWAIIYM